MRVSLIIIFICLLGFIAIADVGQNNNYRILVPGCFSGSEIEPIDDNNQWYGLFKLDSSYVLESVNIFSEPCYDPMIDNPGDSTGVLVKIEHDLKPIVLIQSSKNLQESNIPTVFDKVSSLEPAKPILLGWVNRNAYTLAPLGEVTDEGHRTPSDMLIINYKLKLFDNSTELGKELRNQTLIEYDRLSFDGLPTILWSGDLDADGKLDLLLDLRNHYNIKSYALFLSSEAESDNIVKLVAEFIFAGC